LAEGEIGVETDTLKFKIGDGSTAWADLDYAAIKPDDQANSVYFGSWESKSSDTVYQAESDGFVLAYNTAGSHMKILTDSSNPPTTVRQDHYHSDGVGGWHISAVCPVRKGDYWKVEKASSVYWLPVELALLLAANFQIPDDGYIGSVSSPHAIQIEADGDVVLSQNLYLADGKSIGQSAGPLLTFDDANNKLNISGCNVGIGTTAGDSRLIVNLDTDFPNTPTDPPVMEIAGNSQLALLFRGTKSCYIKGDDGGHFVMGAEDYVAYETGGFGILYERMRITPEGKVGIGTQNPNSLLDVAGDANIGGSLDVTDEIITASYIGIGGPIAGGLTGPNRLFIDTEPSTGKSRFFCYGKDTSTRGQFEISLRKSDESDNLQAFLIDSDGKVGIGTTPGDSRLKVHLDTDFPNEPTDPPVMEIAGNSQLALLFSSTKSCYIKGDYDGNFVMGAEGFVAYETGGFGWAYERMRITPEGKVGIGTSSVSSNLTILTSGGSGGIHVGNTVGAFTSHQAEIEVRTQDIPTYKQILTGAGDPHGGFEVGVEGYQGYLLVRDGEGGTKVKLNTAGDSYFNGGKVGIGTSSPKADLHGTGATILGCSNGAVADGDLGNGQVNIWVSEGVNKLTFKVKYSNGTIKTGTVDLA